MNILTPDLRDGALFGGTYRFVPRPRTLAAENLLAAVLGTLLAFAFFRFARDAAPTVNFVLSCVTGILIFVVYTLRARMVGLHAVVITADALVVEGRKGPRRVRWDEVEAACHTYLGGDRWAIRCRDGGPALHFNLDGYSTEEASHINALIRERVEAHRPSPR